MKVLLIVVATVFDVVLARRVYLALRRRPVPKRQLGVKQGLALLPNCVRLLVRLMRSSRVPRGTRVLVGCCLVGVLLPPQGVLKTMLLTGVAVRLVVRRTGERLVSELWPGDAAGLRLVLKAAHRRQVRTGPAEAARPVA